MLLIIGVSIALGVSVAAWLVNHFLGLEVSKMLLSVVTVGVVIVSSVTTLIGVSVAKAEALSFKEFWNGYEISADVSVTTCTRDGSCRYTYQCDAYTVTVPYTTTDSKGNTTTEYRTETRYHDCPYVTEEYTYTVNTTLGAYTVASHIFSTNPQPWRSTDFKGIPGSVAQGEPAQWVAVKERVDAGTPGGVTKMFDYDNYILASQSSILKRYSDQVDRYKEENLLPKPADVASDYFAANKAYGVNVELGQDWQNAVMNFNAAFGSDLQGDLHLVAVDGVDDPDAYAGALAAYWQSPELGENAISKNALVVIIGTDGREVNWARAFTGMPTGNEVVTAHIVSALKDAPFDPDTILGAPRGVVTNNGDDVTIRHSDGLIESEVWGSPAFERTCMMCDDEGDTGLGFTYLSGEIQPSTAAKVWIVVISTLLVLVGWGVTLAMGSNAGTSYTPNPTRNPYRYRY